jgi:hypothetical protein
MVESNPRAVIVDLYAYWKAALAGKKPPMVVDQPECGFYRKGVYQRNEKGNNKRVGWTPVAVFMICADTMIGRIGSEKLGRDVSGDELNELWSYIADNPISEETYRAVAERGDRWPDDPAPPEDAIERIVGPHHNNPPEVLTDKDHAVAIDNAINAAPKAVTNETEAARALGSKNRIAELRLAADKAGKAIYEPIYRVYTAEQKKWSPIIARATAAEKSINTAILTFREKERQRVAAEQEAAAAKQREIDEANERAAQRAIAQGEPEPQPVILEAPTVAMVSPLEPTYGSRKLKEELHTILDSIQDYDAVYAFLKAEPKVKALLLELATAKVKAGFAVPGTTTRQGLI